MSPGTSDTETVSAQLASQADWKAAAVELVNALHALDQDDSRVRLLESLCRRLGRDLYPAFLEILCAIEHGGDETARRLMARTLVSCLMSGRLPAGELPSWGSATVTADRSFGQVRQLGPIEFACAWYAQPNSLGALSQRQFTAVVTALLSLVTSDAEAEALYRRKLAHDSEDPLGGALSNRTRDGLRSLVDAWTTSGPEAAAEAFHATLAEDSLLSQIARPSHLL